MSDRLLQAFGGLLVELGDADIADVVAFEARAHRAHADDVARERDVDRLVLALAHDLQLDLGVDRAAHLLDRLVEGEALHRLVVEMGDDVVGHDAGLGGRRVVDRRDHLDQAVFHRDLDAEPAELAAGLHLHVAEALGVHVARMRIEPGQHAVDRGFDQLAVVGLLDIVGAHPLEHVAEQIELPIGVGVAAFALDPISTIRGWVEQRQCRAGAALRRIREVLRIIREPFRLHLRPTMGLDRLECRPYGTRHRAPAGSPVAQNAAADLGPAPMVATGSPSVQTGRCLPKCAPSRRAGHDTRRRH
jgi:hypothetical protein